MASGRVSADVTQPADTNTGAVRRASLDGSNIQDLISGDLALATGGVVVDDSHLYWTSYAGSPTAGTIRRANLDGSNPQAIVTGQAAPFGIAVDDSYLYWTTGGDGPSSGAVNQAGLDGSNSQPIVTGLAYTPGTVAVGASYLYWVNRGDDTVHLANLDGSNPQTLGSGQGAWGTGGKPRRTCRLTTVHTVARHPAGTLADRPDRPLPRR